MSNPELYNHQKQHPYKLPIINNNILTRDFPSYTLPPVHPIPFFTMGDNSPPGNINADFYEKIDFHGKLTIYTINDTVDFTPETIIDRYKSAKVGTTVAVVCWNEPDPDGEYAFLSGRNPDITEYYKFNTLSVDTTDTRVIIIKFVEKSGGSPKNWGLTLDMARSGKRTIYSNDGDSARIAGKIRASDGDTVTAIYVRNEKTGVELPPGSIYFKWNHDEQKVDIASKEDFPDYLEIEQDGSDRFVVTIDSKQTE
ncbi:membrane binding-domain-containing protein [Xylaria longipes]|nr:membrane binding-domain-containing protein [Xylaria longipes]RYC60859.1 hypothetical protein CHU98_g5372 [Xylaria longipes]